MSPTWTQATVPATSGADGPRLRFLLLCVEGEPVTHQIFGPPEGKAWPLLVYRATTGHVFRAHAIDDLERILGDERVTVPSAADLAWLTEPP